MKVIFAIICFLAAAVVGWFFWASQPNHGRADYAFVVQDPDFAGKTLKHDQAFSVVTYNVGYLSGMANNTAEKLAEDDLKTNLHHATEGLKRYDPDVLALQEVDIASHRSFYQNEAAMLAEHLRMAYRAIAINWDKRYLPFPYWPVSAHFGRIYSGQAVLSRFPLRYHERHVLQRPSHPFWYDAFYLDRLVQKVEIPVKSPAGGATPSLVVLNVHLEAFDAATRKRQTAALYVMAQRYAALQHPVIVLGDFNSSQTRDKGEAWTLAKFRRSNIFREAGHDISDGRNLTFPSDAPKDRLDHIFYTPQYLELRDVSVIHAVRQASDHLPVWAEFRLK